MKEYLVETETRQARMYFIALVLPEHLDEKVLALKKWMQAAYGCKVGLKSPAHITLVPPFWMAEENEETLRGDLSNLAQTVPAFSLTTENFSAFKPRTIFIALAPNETLHAVKKASDNFFRQREYKMKIESRPFHPHITIATRDLHKADFADAWPQFQNKEFNETFTANGLTLLKHNGRTWDAVFLAPFKPSQPAGAEERL